MSRSASRYWLGYLWPPALVFLLLFCSDVEIQGPSVPSVEIGLGDTIVVFPPPGGPILAGVRQLALSADQQSVYVLDAGPAVHRIALDGTLLASFGRSGEGPGELTRPIAAQPTGDGGIWVLDRQRFTRYAPDGSVVRILPLTNRAAATFSPVGGDREVVVPAGQPMVPGQALLTRVGDSGIEDLENIPSDLPAPLADSHFSERFLGWKLAPLGTREVAIVLNGPVLRGWRVFVAEGLEAVDSVIELAMPPTAARVIARESELAAMPDARPSPLSRAGTAAGRLWIVSTGLPDGPLAFTVPVRRGDPSLVVPAGQGFHDRERRVRDVVVLSDRVFLAYEVEVVVRSAIRKQDGVRN